MHKRFLPLFMCASLVYPALGAIISSTNVIITPSSSTSYKANAFQDTGSNATKTHAWVEVENFVVTTPFQIDDTMPVPGATYGNGSPAPEIALANLAYTVPAGLVISSYYLYFDPKASNTSTGSITFSEPVYGVVVQDKSFVHSDFLRILSAPYPANPSFNERGLELGPETLQLSADRKTLFFKFVASSPGDQVRVITLVPEPASVILLGSALAGVWLWRRQRTEG
jgi:hypothetical protein